MILDSKKYLIQKTYIKNWIDTKPEIKLVDHIGDIALASGLHIVLVAHFMIELYGENEELLSKKKRFMEFYGIEGVI
jgi:hypothetical protein